MSYFEQMSGQGMIARIRAVDYDVPRLYLELPNGQTITVDNPSDDFEVGSIVLIRPEENHIELVPNEVWPEESWVGVVRLKLEDITVVDVSGRWKILGTSNHVDYCVGNTVEVRDSLGIIRVLSEKPIKFVDLPTDDDTIITDKFKSQAGSDSVTFDDFGGLESVVERARELIEVSLKSKEALSKIGARPIKGVLFTGPPGTGKTMLARIIANNTDSVFYRISGPEIFSKWYGESEGILRRLFEDAAKQPQAIIFFDEIDSVAGQRDDNSHEASRRVVAQLLTLMDGFAPDENVVVIAATNRPQDIDAALRRPGRFDWEIHFPLPNQRDRELILQSSSQHLAVSADLPYKWIAEKTEGWSGAELTAIWSEAALIAVADKREEIITEDYIGGFERVSVQRNQVNQVLSKGDSK